MRVIRASLAPGVRRLFAQDAVSFRDLRLDGLRADPEAFGASWEEEAARPLARFADRLSTNAVFGGERADVTGLSGVVGLYGPGAMKQRHKGCLWGMFV